MESVERRITDKEQEAAKSKDDDSKLIQIATKNKEMEEAKEPVLDFSR